MLSDGVYDAVIVDVQLENRDRDVSARVTIDLALISGAHKGDVVSVVTAADASDPLALLGLPATLTVVDGEPHVAIER